MIEKDYEVTGRERVTLGLNVPKKIRKKKTKYKIENTQKYPRLKEKEGRTLEKAKKFVEYHLNRLGCFCPACDRLTKRYQISISAIDAKHLINFYQATKGDINFYNWVNKTYPSDKKENRRPGGDFTRLAAWGILEEMQSGDGKPRSGLWRISSLGIDFVMGKIQVQEYMIRHNGIFTEALDSRSIGIKQILKKGGYNHKEEMNTTGL